MNALTPARPRDPATTKLAFTEADFVAIARRAQTDFGLHLTAAKKDLVYSRLAKRLRLLGLGDFAAYCRFIESPAGVAERIEMLSALTTNVTHFFREEHHFQTLRNSVLPPLIEAARSGRRVRIWSAGCSAGQEPYSLAFTLLDLCPDASRLDIRILATDVDPAIANRAKDGIYSADEIQSLPDRMRDRHLVAAPKGMFAIGEQPRQLIRFGVLNLIQDWPFSGSFDVIFCRNVAIYFDKPTQARLWKRFSDVLAPGGTLCIGHSERLGGPAVACFEPVGVTTYRKSNSTAATAASIPTRGAAG